MRELVTVGLLAVSNVGAAMAAQATKIHWLDDLAPYLESLIKLGQIAVAVVTVWYIWRKLQNLPRNKDK